MKDDTISIPWGSGITYKHYTYSSNLNYTNIWSNSNCTQELDKNFLNLNNKIKLSIDCTEVSWLDQPPRPFWGVPITFKYGIAVQAEWFIEFPSNYGSKCSPQSNDIPCMWTVAVHRTRFTQRGKNPSITTPLGPVQLWNCTNRITCSNIDDCSWIWMVADLYHALRSVCLCDNYSAPIPKTRSDSIIKVDPKQVNK